MKINITWLEKKHIESLNKDVLEINGTDEQGNSIKFAVWQDFPGFNEIMNGGFIEGNLWEKPGTGKFTLYPPKVVMAGQTGGNKGRFQAGMKEVMKEKQEGIEKSQYRKEQGIRVSSTIRMAVDIVIAELGGEKIIDEAVIKAKIKEWRVWFWDVWSEPDDNPIYPQ